MNEIDPITGAATVNILIKNIFHLKSIGNTSRAVEKKKNSQDTIATQAEEIAAEVVEIDFEIVKDK